MQDKPMQNKPWINRRTFIQLIAAISSGLGIQNQAAHAFSSPPANKASSSTQQESSLGDPSLYQNLSEPWLTLASVQEHLFPASVDVKDQRDSDTSGLSSPGAQDIAALVFLKNMLEADATDTNEKDFILKGVSWLNDLSNKQFQLSFVQLNSDQKENILRRVEKSDAGSRWLSQMMTYLIEALLSDPVYGGNKNQLGWQWLEHIPGFPRPDINKVYFKLGLADGKSTKRVTKA